MPQYLLKASVEEFDSWRAAASGPLAPWIRAALNDATDPRVVSHRYDPEGAARQLEERRAFKSDFKGKR